jgi:hypothetical protein
MELLYSPKYYAFLAAGSFLMAALSFSGLFLQQEDLIGRLITGSAWSIVTLGWLGQLFQARVNSS